MTVRIEVAPAILVGKRVVKYARLAVEFVLDLMSDDRPAEQIHRNDPHLTSNDLQASLNYAAESLKRKRGLPLAV